MRTGARAAGERRALREAMTDSGKHLALFIRSLGGGGGAERMMVTLAGPFAGRGHRVDLLLRRVEGNIVGDVPE